MRRTKALSAGIVLLALTGIAWAAGENIVKHSIKYLDSVVVNWGTDLDVAVQWTGSKLTVVPLADDTEIELGNGTLSTDLQVFGNTTASGFSFDASADDLKLEDSTSLMFGTGAGAFQGNAGDVEIRWDATDLDVLAAADNSVIKIGATGNSFDLWLYGSDSTKTIVFDASADDLIFDDSVSIMLGTGQDVEIRWDGTDLDILAAADNSIVKWGAAGNSFDHWFYGSDADKYFSFDASADDLKLEDSVSLMFGTGAGAGPGTAGDIEMRWDATDFDILGAADDLVLNIGNGTNSFDVTLFGNIAGSKVTWDASANVLRLNGPVRPTGFNSCPNRFELDWVAGRRGLVTIQASILTTTEYEFEVLGVNADATEVTAYAEGGLILTTEGVDGDETILVPSLVANTTPWTMTTWGTDKEVEWECDVTTGGNITNAIIWAGLKLTSAEAVSTDNDAAWFRYEDDVNAGEWQACSSIATVDVATDTNLAVVIDTRYHLKIACASDRTAQFWINGALVYTSAALTSGDLIPYIGVASDGASAAKALRVHRQSISRVPN